MNIYSKFYTKAKICYIQKEQKELSSKEVLNWKWTRWHIASRVLCQEEKKKIGRRSENTGASLEVYPSDMTECHQDGVKLRRGAFSKPMKERMASFQRQKKKGLLFPSAAWITKLWKQWEELIIQLCSSWGGAWKPIRLTWWWLSGLNIRPYLVCLQRAK